MSTQAPSTTQETTPLFLRVADVSRMTGLSRSEVQRAIESGKLRARRYGQRSLLIAPADIHAWLEADTKVIEAISA